MRLTFIPSLALSVIIGAVSAQAQTYTVLHKFTGAPTDGSVPFSAVIRDAAGNLYATTEYGGTSTACNNGCGVVYKRAATGTETVLHNFTGGADGNAPTAGLIRDS